MKKILTVLLALLMVVGLTACNSEGEKVLYEDSICEIIEVHKEKRVAGIIPAITYFLEDLFCIPDFAYFTNEHGDMCRYSIYGNQDVEVGDEIHFVCYEITKENGKILYDYSMELVK